MPHANIAHLRYNKGNQKVFMKIGDLVKFNHQNHKRTGMNGLIVSKRPCEHSVDTLSVLWASGEIIDEWPTYLKKETTRLDSERS
jgi:hypothetical protein